MSLSKNEENSAQELADEKAEMSIITAAQSSEVENSAKQTNGKRQVKTTLLPNNTEVQSDSAAFAGKRFQKAELINILFVGRTQTGKSAIIEALQNPYYCKTDTGFSQTRKPELHSLIMSDEDTKKVYQVNIIDTPGLKEAAGEGETQRSDSELLNLARMFVEMKITEINCVCLVSQAARLHQHDLDVFRPLMEFLGPDFSENTMMILTHADSFSPEKLEELRESIETHPRSKEAYGFCKLGVFYHGVVNYDDLKLYAHKKALYDDILATKIELLTPLRRTLVNQFIKMVGKQKEVGKIADVIKEIRKKEDHIRLSTWEEINAKSYASWLKTLFRGGNN